MSIDEIVIDLGDGRGKFIVENPTPEQENIVRIAAERLKGYFKRKAYDEALKKSNIAVKTSLNAVFTSDLEGKVNYANPAAARMWGFESAEEMIGTNIRDYWTEESQENAGEIINILMEKGTYLGEGLIGKRTDGSEFLVKAQSAMIKDDSGNPIGMVGSFDDITKRKQAEEALKESEAKYRALFETSADGILIADTETRQLGYANPALCRMLGYTQEELTRLSVKDIHPKESIGHVLSEFKAQARGEKTLAEDIPCLRKDGRIIYTDINSALTTIQGKRYNVGFFRDITQIKHLEEQLQIRQRMDSVGTLASGIAHDFNNLLAVILGNLDITNMDETLKPAHKESLQNALKAGHNAAELIKQLQRLSEESISEKTSVDLYEVSRDVFGLLENTTDRIIGKELDLKGKKFYVDANAQELHQILLNLGTNAIRALEEKGAVHGDYIKIRAKNYTVREEDRTSLPPGNYVHIFFEDTGMGMPDKVRRRAFDPLFTTRGKGSQKGQGLGLAMVYTIITKSHEGYIDIETQEGKGTTMHIYLPKAAPAEKIKPKEIQGVYGGNETILVIDDEEGLRDLAVRTLQMYGYKVLTASNGRKGLELYDKETIDLVLLDLTMPEMSGSQVLERMLKVDPNVKAVISTGQSDKDARKGVLERASGYINKPYDIVGLAQTIRTVLDK